MSDQTLEPIDPTPDLRGEKPLPGGTPGGRLGNLAESLSNEIRKPDVPNPGQFEGGRDKDKKDKDK